MNFGSHTDAVVAVAVALINVATPGHRRGREYQPSADGLATALGDALRRGRDAVGNPSGQTVEALVRLAHEVRPVFTDVAAGHLDRAVSTRSTTCSAGTGPCPISTGTTASPGTCTSTVRPDSTLPSGAEAIAVGLATVLGSEYADRLGVCQAPACDRVFVDVSRNGTRSFCSTACQNRVKAASHRARIQASGSTDPFSSAAQSAKNVRTATTSPGSTGTSSSV